MTPLWCPKCGEKDKLGVKLIGGFNIYYCTHCANWQGPDPLTEVPRGEITIAGAGVHRDCLMCGYCHPASPPPLSMGRYAKEYAACFGWEPCWGEMPDAYANKYKDREPWVKVR